MSMLIRRGFFCARQAPAAHWLWCGNAAPHPTVQQVFAHDRKKFFGEACLPVPQLLQAKSAALRRQTTPLRNS